MNLNFNISQTTTIQFVPNLNTLIHSLQNEHAIILIEDAAFKIYQEQFKQIGTERIYTIQVNEENKNIHIVMRIVEHLLTHKIKRLDNIAIIGGGVFSDVALFACSIFKRGVKCTLIPTTLLSMVDASIGGKNGINFNSIKNTIGTIYLPCKNIICTDFLSSLPKEQLLSGWAEILKIALISDTEFYQECLIKIQQSLLPTKDVIAKAITLKIQIIEQDPSDKDIRQALNLGHTIAHAIEGLYDEKKDYVPHGIAVAAGIIIETDIAAQRNVLDKNIAEKIQQDFKNIFPKIPLIKNDIPVLIQKMHNDKKNIDQQIIFTLLEKIEKIKLKVAVSETEIIQAIKRYL